MTCDSKDHGKHMCALQAQGLDKCIEVLSDNPSVECRHCGIKANSIQNVCAAHMVDIAPNVEGGHGNVSLDDVGKPHAGAPKKGA